MGFFDKIKHIPAVNNLLPRDKINMKDGKVRIPLLNSEKLIEVDTFKVSNGNTVVREVSIESKVYAVTVTKENDFEAYVKVVEETNSKNF